MEKCENCGLEIGKLEIPSVFNGHVVCTTCHTKLSKPNTTKDQRLAVFLIGVGVIAYLLGQQIGRNGASWMEPLVGLFIIGGFGCGIAGLIKLVFGLAKK